MNSIVIASMVRHVLTAAGGGFFVAWGMDGEMVNALVGSVATLAGVAWSVYDKRK